MAILCNYSTLFVLPPHLPYPTPIYFSTLPPPYFTLLPPFPPPPRLSLWEIFFESILTYRVIRGRQLFRILLTGSRALNTLVFFYPIKSKKMITLNKLGLLKCSKLVENLWHLKPHLIIFPVFKVLETWRRRTLMLYLGIVKFFLKIYRAVFK